MEVALICKIRARGGAGMPALGLSTWTMGEEKSRREQDVAALRLGIDLGMTQLNNAGMYADGGAEEAVIEAVRGRLDEVFIVTKVLRRTLPARIRWRLLSGACAASAQTISTSISSMGMGRILSRRPSRRSREAGEGPRV